MSVQKVLIHMNAGDGNTSYANNSALQKDVISKTRSMLDETLKHIFVAHGNAFPKCLKMADLGCSSGPNTLLAISHIMDTVHELCRNNNVNNLPELKVCLNDLPDNDFNNLFKLVSKFSHNLDCFIHGVPGSFYDRLFPSNSLHFAYSNYSLQWLSQIPDGVGDNNKENIYIASTTPTQVFEAYKKQHEKDFSRFLRIRGQEIIQNGRMVLGFVGRSAPYPFPEEDVALITLLGETLFDLVAEGYVKKADLYSFNMPIYTPCLEEVESVINSEGSFRLDKKDISRIAHDFKDDRPNMAVVDNLESGRIAADHLRAFVEPLLAGHFGSSVNMDALFHKYAEKMADYLATKKPSNYTIVISLTRK